MKKISKYMTHDFNLGIEGVLLPLSIVPFFFLSIIHGQNFKYNLFIAIASFSAGFFATFAHNRCYISKILGYLYLAGTIFLAWPHIYQDPFAMLTCSISSISLFFIINYFSKPRKKYKKERIQEQNIFNKAYWATISSFVVLILYSLSNQVSNIYTKNILLISFLISSLALFYWIYKVKVMKLFFLIILEIIVFILCFTIQNFFWEIALITGLINFYVVIKYNTFYSYTRKTKENWIELIIYHPARILLLTFSLLCILGTFVLSLPCATVEKGISIINAFFTSVSAVCVTGLIVLDTPVDFTIYGQLFILFLIQLGGLGIMSITTVGLHIMGKRLSLKHEVLLTSITNDNHKDVVSSLTTVLKFTFLTELIGACLLTIAFFCNGINFSQSLWKGIFTSISAFCNAGFSLQSDSLMSFQDSFFITGTISFLIILGGLAPATSLMIPNWIRKKNIPTSAKVVLTTTLLLLFSGTIFILVFEWNNTLENMNIYEKVINAWFQSATLRTAGFNSIDMADISNPTLLIMLVLMFIGGSPGGTAGGIKTTTIGVILITFWAYITNKKGTIVYNRRIRPLTIVRAITIIIAGVLTWFIIIIMLETTQTIPLKELVFEVTSALGTVGLSMNTTASLDEIGKGIITLAMFVGRVGPVTIFMLLSNDAPTAVTRCPDAKLNLM